MKTIAQNCRVEGCDRQYHSKGYCHFHWQRAKNGKSFDDPFNCKHGYSSHYLYATWESMKQRCLNNNHHKYFRYGGRGISIYPEWLEAPAFIEWVLENIGDKPSAVHSIDRINNDGNYEPGNIKWSNKSEQIVNQGIRNDNKSGYKGLSWDKSRLKWAARKTVDGKYKYIGRYDKKEDAIKALGLYALLILLL